MTTFTRGLRAVSRAMALALAVTATLAEGADAQQTLVVGNDRGGFVGARAQEIRQLNAAQARVEIRGSVCISSCTMYLGARDVCVSPSTTFGFHGPSRFGTPLPQSQFEHFSNVMARHYNPSLRQWFMSEARYSIGQPYEVSGVELIRLGYRSC
ncbi:hypothetical protein [Wenxinia marina]|uniref:Uncharacterized protein n=1 Tax=Wenxinia marina DSM 24838 TaxID=1123501 RepID=A0A0D0QFW3_9RHOB|nr:hypothetical protein [Wenxinia marina]KIQ71147.1 hypothetical protein Wenmar_00526 [Wenxinia marina DSM 24838]GGL54477.1 hypothetical protein GCM10011392_06110 [Wenxinia marina]